MDIFAGKYSDPNPLDEAISGAYSNGFGDGQREHDMALNKAITVVEKMVKQKKLQQELVQELTKLKRNKARLVSSPAVLTRQKEIIGYRKKIKANKGKRG